MTYIPCRRYRMPLISNTLSSLARPTSRRLAAGGRFLRKCAPRRTRLPLVNKETDMTPLVGLIMGSPSDWDTLQHAATALEQLGVPFETRIVSAHHTPEHKNSKAKKTERRGLERIIAGAGGAAQLPGMVAAKTVVPVLGVPVQSQARNGMDSLLSIVQMPAGVPVGTRAIGKAGAGNAALLAAR